MEQSTRELDNQPLPDKPRKSYWIFTVLIFVLLISLFFLVGIFSSSQPTDISEELLDDNLNTSDEIIYALTRSDYVFWSNEKPEDGMRFHPLTHSFTDLGIPLYKWDDQTRQYSKIIENLLSLPNAPVSGSSNPELIGLTIESVWDNKIYFGMNAHEGSWLFDGYVLDLENIQAGYTKLPVVSSWKDAIKRKFILGLSEGSTYEQYSIVLYNLETGELTNLLDSAELAPEESIFSGCMGDCYDVSWDYYWGYNIKVNINYVLNARSAELAPDSSKIREVVFHIDPTTDEISRIRDEIYQMSN